MHLLIDFLAVVKVRALIGKCRFNGVVAEWMKDDAAPENLRRRLFRERRNLRRVLPPQVAVDHQELRQVVPFGLDLGRAGEDCRDNPVEEFVVERNLALLERLGKGRVVEISSRGISGLVACEKSNRSLQILIVAKREKCD